MSLLTCCSSSEPACVVDLDLDCQALFDPPTFDALYDSTLHTTCASGNGTCHTADARMGGLEFEDRDHSYDLLLGNADGRARVKPGDPACSLLIERLESDDPGFRMPPASEPLPAAEICTFVQWIELGANR